MNKRKPKPRLSAFKVEPQVIIDNTLSDALTVLEINGLDRPGLLYDVTREISDLNLDIASAHIATFGEKAVDDEGRWKVDGDAFRVTGFLPTGRGVHGLYPSRDARYLYATNRGEGTISVIDFATEKVVRKWVIPGGGSPDMGGVSADGKVLWLSGRYNGVVYAISTVSGKLLARIPVGRGPHGLCVWPQPGRYSLGHTGILR